MVCQRILMIEMKMIKIKVVKLRKKVVKVVTRPDRKMDSNESRSDLGSPSNSYKKQEPGRNYGHNREYGGGILMVVGSGERTSTVRGSFSRDNAGNQQQGNRGGYSGRNYGHNREYGGGILMVVSGERTSTVRGSFSRDNAGSQQQGNRGGYSGRNYGHSRDSNSGTQPQTFRRVIRAKVVSNVVPAPVDSDNKGINRKLGEKKKQQQESQKSYKRKKEETEIKTIEQKVFEQLQKKKKRKFGKFNS